MGRASRLKALKRDRKGFAPTGKQVGDGPQITLSNPETNNFEAFIAGNATVCRNPSYHGPEILCTAACTPMAEEGSGRGQHLVLCGAGPSLAEHAAEHCTNEMPADQVWGCNSALTWLVDNGYRATHGFAVDQTAHMCAEWVSAPDVEYLLASSVHPHLVEYLVSKNRRTRFFHNFVGIKKPPVMVEPGKYCDYEDLVYMTLYAPTVRCGSGLNAVTRALDVAQFMGFETITVLGADCALRAKTAPPDAPVGSPEMLAWLRSTVMHADGGNALASGATPVTLSGEIDGRLWTSKPDMLITAQWLMRMAKTSNGRIRLIGDTLPNALMHKDETFLARLPALTDSSGKPMQYPGGLE